MEFFRKAKSYVLGQVRWKLLHLAGTTKCTDAGRPPNSLRVAFVKDLAGASRANNPPSSEVPGHEAQFNDRPARTAAPRKAAEQPVLQSAGYGASGGVQVRLKTSRHLPRQQHFDQFASSSSPL